MDRDPRAYLWDVQQAANAIEEFTAGLDAAGYAQNALVRAAVERQFEIIGFRNVLIHGYAAVNDARVWQITETSLPNLRAAVSALLAELGPPDT